MKKIINGLTYNTETAQEIATYDNGLPLSDFHNFTETLYKTKKGRFFIHGTGGAMTGYAVSAGTNSTAGSSDITAFSEDEAREWLERYNFADEYEELFETEEA